MKKTFSYHHIGKLNSTAPAATKRYSLPLWKGSITAMDVIPIRIPGYKRSRHITLDYFFPTVILSENSRIAIPHNKIHKTRFFQSRTAFFKNQKISTPCPIPNTAIPRKKYTSRKASARKKSTSAVISILLPCPEHFPKTTGPECRYTLPSRCSGI